MKKKEVVKQLFWSVGLFLTRLFGKKAGQYLLEQYQGNTGLIAGQVFMASEKSALECYAPILNYREEGQESRKIYEVIEEVSAQCLGILGVKEKKTNQEQFESPDTTQQIIEANANAIAAMVLAENQINAIEEENNAAKETDEPPTENFQSEDLSMQENSMQENSMQENSAEESLTEESSTDDTAAESNLIEDTASQETQPVVTISRESLADFDYLKNTFFTVDANTTVGKDLINAEELLDRDMTLQQDASAPQILIYHTHSQETFSDSIEGDEDTSIIGVGNYLTDILRNVYGYQVIHIVQTFDLVDGELDRSKAYNYARDAIETVLDENPSVEVVIDLHRDGVDESRRLVTEIDGRQTAKIMFFNGLSYTVNQGDLDSLPNPYIQDNLAFSFQLELLAAQYYPSFVRTTYLKGYRYNLHFRPKSLLLECGAQTNTVEEAKNAMEPFADILHKVLNGA